MGHRGHGVETGRSQSKTSEFWDNKSFIRVERVRGVVASCCLCVIALCPL